MRIRFGMSASFTVLGTCTAISGEPRGDIEADKSRYGLFNPTPGELLRELTPDRPDATESPITVDAGHFAMEVSVFDWRRRGDSNTYTLMSTNLKVGLTNDTDLQLVVDSYVWEAPGSGGGSGGFGDVQLRLKYNLWGNDRGETALALFPFVKTPIGTVPSNNEWEGGLIVPVSTQLAERVSLGFMAEVDVVSDDVSHGYEVEFLHSAVIGIDLTKGLGTFIEYIGIVGQAPYQAYGSGGFTLGANDDLVFDCGVQVGLNGVSEDLGVFAGFTKRF